MNGSETTIVFTRPAACVGSISGIVTVPRDHDPEKEKLPVIVFLHGAGERADGTEAGVFRVCVHGVPKYFSRDAEYLGLRAVTVSPQCPDGLIWDQITLQLMAYLEESVLTFGGDPTRVALTGLSMGGFGTWNLLTTYPEKFCRAAPICGGGVPWRVDGRLKGKKIRVFHSVDDMSVPYMCSVLMVERAQAFGADVEFTTYCGEGHGCWDRAYEQTDLIPWLVNG
ncbi:MAG: phospholipase [Clostridia bacterium]|nr:phospholipase [Clostridia bacterium]